MTEFALEKWIWHCLPKPVRRALTPIVLAAALLADLIWLAAWLPWWLGRPARRRLGGSPLWSALAMALCLACALWLAQRRRPDLALLFEALRAESAAGDVLGGNVMYEPTLSVDIRLHISAASALHVILISSGCLLAAWCTLVQVIAGWIATVCLRAPVMSLGFAVVIGLCS